MGTIKPHRALDMSRLATLDETFDTEIIDRLKPQLKQTLVIVIFVHCKNGLCTLHGPLMPIKTLIK